MSEPYAKNYLEGDSYFMRQKLVLVEWYILEAIEWLHALQGWIIHII